MQRGSIVQKHGAWHLRYRLHGKEISVKLADYSDDYRTKKSVRTLAERYLQPANQGAPGDPQTVQQFVETVYFPHAEKNKRPSTVHGYRKLYNAYIQGRIGSFRLFEFRTRDAQRLLDEIAAENDLTHQTFKNIKSFLSAVFKLAKRLGSVEQNPIRDTEAPKGKESEETHAYTEAEITEMRKILDGVGKVAVTVAGYTGLSLGELQGLQWSDVTKDSIKVQRTVWRGIEGQPKTKARKDSVPLLKIVKDTLKEHRAANPLTVWVFENPEHSKPYDLATMGSKSIKDALKGSNVEWRGWHGCRRGFATRLHEHGVQDKIIQSLMRHSSLSVTMKHYVKATPEANIEAMRKLNPKKRNRK
jgi:integrase